MLQVNYQVAIASTIYTPNSQSRLLNLGMNAALSIPVHCCTIALSGAEAVNIQVKDSVTLSLGYDNQLTQVFAGKVSAVQQSFDRITIQAVSDFQALTRARSNLLYEQSSAADIVKNLAQSRLGLTVSKAETGLQFPSYAIGDHQSVYDYLHRLAQQCGFDLYANPQDQLVFAQYDPQTTHKFQYGIDILAIEQAATGAIATGIEVYGESPASQQGDQTTSWLSYQPVKGSAGKTATLRFVEPIARTQDAANKIAAAYLAKHSRQRRGRVKVLGIAAVKLGDAVQLSQLPQSDANGTFKVTGITHRLNRQRGFYTTIDWENA